MKLNGDRMTDGLRSCRSTICRPTGVLQKGVSYDDCLQQFGEASGANRKSPTYVNRNAATKLCDAWIDSRRGTESAGLPAKIKKGLRAPQHQWRPQSKATTMFLTLTDYFAAGTQTLSAEANSTPATSVVSATRCKPAFFAGLA
jgi:hypothetical protein